MLIKVAGSVSSAFVSGMLNGVGRDGESSRCGDSDRTISRAYEVPGMSNGVGRRDRESSRCGDRDRISYVVSGTLNGVGRGGESSRSGDSDRTVSRAYDVRVSRGCSSLYVVGPVSRGISWMFLAMVRIPGVFLISGSARVPSS